MQNYWLNFIFALTFSVYFYSNYPILLNIQSFLGLYRVEFSFANDYNKTAIKIALFENSKENNLVYQNTSDVVNIKKEQKEREIE